MKSRPSSVHSCCWIRCREWLGQGWTLWSQAAPWQRDHFSTSPSEVFERMETTRIYTQRRSGSVSNSGVKIRGRCRGGLVDTRGPWNTLDSQRSIMTSSAGCLDYDKILARHDRWLEATRLTELRPNCQKEHQENAGACRIKLSFRAW